MIELVSACSEMRLPVCGHDLEGFEHRAGRRRRDFAEGVAHVELEADHAAVDQLRHVARSCPRRAARRGRNRHAPSRPRSCASRRGRRAVPVAGMVFGMSNTVVTPPNAAAAVPLCPVFLVRIAGVAEMHMHVDRAGQDVQAGCVDGFAARPASRRRAPTATIFPSLMATLGVERRVGRRRRCRHG